MDKLVNNNLNRKIGRNDKCPCGSNKKFKICCFGKEKPEHIFKKGHDISSDKLHDVFDRLTNKYTDHKVIDITNLLSDSTYKQIQLRNFTDKIIMIAERKDINDEVFSSRGPGDIDVIVMYHGAYTCFNYTNINNAFSKVESMIDERI